MCKLWRLREIGHGPYTPSQNQGDSVCLLPHTPRRFPTPIRAAIDTTRAQACVLLDACTTVTHPQSSGQSLIFQSRPVTARSSTHRCVYAPAMYTIHTASARVNAPTAYTAHPACVYALPLARKRTHPPAYTYTRPRGVHACSLPATAYTERYTPSVRNTQAPTGSRKRLNAPTCVYMPTYRSRVQGTYPPTARVNAPIVAYYTPYACAPPAYTHPYSRKRTYLLYNIHAPTAI